MKINGSSSGAAGRFVTAGAVLATFMVHAPAHAQATTPEEYARFDALGEPGLAISYPPAIESLLGDNGGWRTSLADHDASLTIRGSFVQNYDVLQNNPHNPQVYAGQKFTSQSNSIYPTYTQGLGAIGLPNSKLIVGLISYASSWSASQGSSEVVPHFQKLAYYQSFFDKKLEIKTGYLPNYTEFIGVFTGGSPLLTTGLSSLVPIEVGLSADPAPSPTFNLTLHGPRDLYFKGGVQRSSSPLGQEYQAGHDGPLNLRYRAERASALYIGEFGQRREAGPDTGSRWVRAGALYNTSDFTNLENGRYTNNHTLFALGDFQVAQPYKSMPYRGIFVGGSAFYAKDEVNVISEYYELRLYSVGLIESRPADGMTFNINRSTYSKVARRTIGAGLDAPAGQFQVTVSYAARLARGLYISPSLSYVHGPAFGDYNDAAVVGVNLFVQL